MTSSNPPSSPTPPSIDSTHLYDILTSYGLCVLKNGTVNDDGEAADNLLTLFESIMLEVIGQTETLESWEDWYAKTKSHGGSKEEYYRLKAIINNYNNLRAEQRTKAAAALERLRNG